MFDTIEKLQQWLDGLDGSLPAEWALLPDIGLYMDQVQTYIDRQLSLYRRDEQDKLLTPAMINNYIKDNLIPRAEAKKYSPVHLALLIMIATLKQVLSMQDLNHLLAVYREQEEVAKLYRQFLEVQSSCLLDSTAHIRQQLQQLQQEAAQKGGASGGPADPGVSETDLRELALELCIEARTKILIAERIFSALPGTAGQDEPAQRQKTNKKEKKQTGG